MQCNQCGGREFTEIPSGDVYDGTDGNCYQDYEVVCLYCGNFQSTGSNEVPCDE